MSERKDFSFHRGEVWGLDVTVRGSAGEVNLSLSGTQAFLRLATVPAPDGTTSLTATWNLGFGLSIGTSAASVQSVLKADITDAMQTAAGIPNPARGRFNSYDYEIRVVELGSLPSTQMVGRIDVYPSLYKEFA